MSFFVISPGTDHVSLDPREPLPTATPTPTAEFRIDDQFATDKGDAAFCGRAIDPERGQVTSPFEAVLDGDEFQMRNDHGTFI